VAGKDFESDPLIAVLTSHLSGARAEIQVGLALQRVLLTATARGLAVSFLSHVVEVPEFRDELRRLIGGTRRRRRCCASGAAGPSPPRHVEP